VLIGRSLVVGLVVATLFVAGANAGPFEEANAAWARADYATAIQLFRLLAERGDAKSQFILGDFYNTGQGVQKDYREAAKWLRKAADQGDAAAQHNLGNMYEKGQGVPQDYVLSYMWYDLAASAALPMYAEVSAQMRDAVAAKMTREQLAEAQRLTREWKPTP